MLLQTALQPWSLILRPLAFAITVPYVWVSSFFQNVTVLGDAPRRARLFSSGRSRRQSSGRCRPTLRFDSSVFTFHLVEYLVALVLVPQLLKSFLNVETVFSRSSTRI